MTHKTRVENLFADIQKNKVEPNKLISVVVEDFDTDEIFPDENTESEYKITN